MSKDRIIEDRLGEVWSEFVACTESHNRLYELIDETNKHNRCMGVYHMWAVQNHCNNYFTLTWNGNVKLDKVPLERALGFMEAKCDTANGQILAEIIKFE